MSSGLLLYLSILTATNPNLCSYKTAIDLQTPYGIEMFMLSRLGGVSTLNLDVLHSGSCQVITTDMMLDSDYPQACGFLTYPSGVRPTYRQASSKVMVTGYGYIQDSGTSVRAMAIGPFILGGPECGELSTTARPEPVQHGSWQFWIGFLTGVVLTLVLLAILVCVLSRWYTWVNGWIYRVGQRYMSNPAEHVYDYIDDTAVFEHQANAIPEDDAVSESESAPSLTCALGMPDRRPSVSSMFAFWNHAYTDDSVTSEYDSLNAVYPPTEFSEV